MRIEFRAESGTKVEIELTDEEFRQLLERLQPGESVTILRNDRPATVTKETQKTYRLLEAQQG
jgi:bifunctional DNA-binding transcriptional regulator/antitoxin component of YhaV-PrlF toxin-antitoxin module